MADLTPELLAQLRALAAGATPGPWFYNSYSVVCSAAKTHGYDHAETPDCVVPTWKTSCGEPRGSCHGCPFFEWDYLNSPLVASVPPHHGDTATGQHADDAEYVAAVSPDVVLGLLDEIERLRTPIDSRGRPCRVQPSGRTAYLIEGEVLWPEGTGWTRGVPLDVQVLVPIDLAPAREDGP